MLTFKRACEESELLIALNFSQEARRLSLPRPAELLLSTGLDREHGPMSQQPMLRADEGIVVRLRQ